MTAFYVMLKVSILLGFILFPLLINRKNKNQPLTGLSDFAINADGKIEKIVSRSQDPSPTI